MSQRKLYELCGHDAARVFSPYCWRSRMALVLKGLDFDSVPWRFTETEKLAFAKHDKVPVLVDGETVVPDSWAIAQHLDQAYPEAPKLLQGPPATYRFAMGWTDSVLSPGIGRMIVSDIPALLGEERAYFIESREKRYGMTLADVTADREARLPAFRATLSPLRQVFREQPYLGGEAADYADCIVFGSFMWARSVSPLPLLEPDDAVFAWRERMLDAAGGMARKAPCFGA
jgi:glutathione S-transferase